MVLRHLRAEEKKIKPSIPIQGLNGHLSSVLCALARALFSRIRGALLRQQVFSNTIYWSKCEKRGGASVGYYFFIIE